ELPVKRSWGRPVGHGRLDLPVRHPFGGEQTGPSTRPARYLLPRRARSAAARDSGAPAAGSQTASNAARTLEGISPIARIFLPKLIILPEFPRSGAARRPVTGLGGPPRPRGWAGPLAREAHAAPPRRPDGQRGALIQGFPRRGLP